MAHIVCRVGNAPLACHDDGMGPVMLLLDRSMVVMLVRSVGHELGRQPVKLLLFT